MPPPYGTLNPAGLAPIPAYICPSTPDAPSDYGPYFQLLGFPPAAFILPRTDYAPIKGLHRSLAVCAGMPDRSTNNAMLGTEDSEKHFGIKFGEVTDGLSNTILIGEEAGRQKLYFRGKPIPGSTLLDGGLTLNSYYGDHNVARQLRGYAGTDPSNPRLPGCSAINVFNENGLYSFHSGGIQVVLGDGSVQFLSENTATSIFASLITRNGGENVQITP